MFLGVVGKILLNLKKEHNYLAYFPEMWYRLTILGGA